MRTRSFLCLPSSFRSGRYFSFFFHSFLSLVDRISLTPMLFFLFAVALENRGSSFFLFQRFFPPFTWDDANPPRRFFFPPHDRLTGGTESPTSSSLFLSAFLLPPPHFFANRFGGRRVFFLFSVSPRQDYSFLPFFFFLHD